MIDEAGRRENARRELAFHLSILFAADNKGSKWAIGEHGFMDARAGYGRICPRGYEKWPYVKGVETVSGPDSLDGREGNSWHCG
jgi:hypothetical protein